MKNLNYLPSLDGIRAVSIVLVIGSHLGHSSNFNKNLTTPFNYLFNGEVGVTIFFVLSGFLITYLLMKEEKQNGAIHLPSFYIRRFLRIFPVYYLFIGCLFVLDLTTKVNFTTCEYVSSLFFFKNFGCGQWIDEHLWSLAVEEQFYLLWPLLLFYLPKKSRLPFALALITLAPLFRVYFYTQQLTGLRMFSFFTNMDALMIGALAGMYYEKQQLLVSRLLHYRPHLLRIISLIVIYSIWMLKQHLLLGIITISLGTTIQSLAAVYLITSYTTIRKGMGYKLLNLKPMAFIGVLSYSLYIWQQLFLTSGFTYSNMSLWFLGIPYNLAALCTTALCSYYLFEKPLMSLRHRFKASTILSKKLV